MSAQGSDAARHPVVRFVGAVVIAAVALMFVASVFLCARGVLGWRTALHEFTCRSAIAYFMYLFVKMYYDVEELKKERYKPDTTSTFVYNSPQQKFDELPDGKFGAVIWGAFGTGMEVRGKHPNMSKEEIKKRLGCADKYSMACFSVYNETEFMVSYFTD